MTETEDTRIPEHDRKPHGECEYLKAGCCYYCCETCNYVSHTCGGCGEELDHNGFEWDSSGAKKKHGGCCD